MCGRIIILEAIKGACFLPLKQLLRTSTNLQLTCKILSQTDVIFVLNSPTVSVPYEPYHEKRGFKTCCTVLIGWMDDLQFYVLFKGISVISG